MAMIIDLHEAMSRHGPTTVRPPQGADAQIVFFPGIRYERQDAPGGEASGDTAPFERDTLKLPEK